jgi:uncharacterized membrane protein YedE/YeeE
VIGWLDLFGNWDPTLAFVMAGAIVPMFFAWRIAEGRAPYLGGEFPSPADPAISRDLIAGSVLFGMGWGLAGLCPGPAIASLTYGGIGGIIFLVAMAGGMFLAPTVRLRMDSLTAAT